MLSELSLSLYIDDVGATGGDVNNEKTRTFLERSIAPSLLLVLVAIYFGTRFRAGNAFLAYFEDDFFYYLAVTRNIVAGKGSTFDGFHPTNGYHPLWLLTNVLLALLFHGHTFYYALLILMAGSVLATYYLAARCFSLYLTYWNASCCAFFIAAEFALITSGGMEIVLAVPLAALLCEFRLRRFRWTRSGGVFYGLLASSVILARLDAILPIALLAVLELLWSMKQPANARLRVAVGFIVGLVPVALYLVVNLLLFHIATPVSGAAKQLRTSHLPNLAAIKIAMLGGWFPVVMLSRPVLVGIFCVAALLVIRGRGRLAADHLPVVWAVILFPVLQLGALSLLSDWPIWEWYFYSFVVAAMGVILVLGTREDTWLLPVGRLAGTVAGVVGLGLLCKLAVHDWRAAAMSHHAMYDSYYAAEDLARFAETHPGTYAMGDRAGLVGYEIHQPLIQLEGLMMDKPFLQNIRQQRNLLETLNAYQVRYYIATNPTRVPLPTGGACFMMREPIQAGPTSPVMQGVLCSEPVLTFHVNGIHTYIFDMQGKAVGAERRWR